MRRIALCIALLCATCICAFATVPPHLSQEFNPLGKKHSVSRSTFHTDQGLVRDTNRAYADQGTSHIRHAYKQNTYSNDDGVHLWDPYIYQNVTEAAMAAFNTTATLPTIEEAASGVPEQVKISITARAGEMVINWLTWNTTNSVVKYGTSSGNYPNSVTGSSFTFVDPNSFHIIRYIHNVLLTDLGSMTTYYYVVGDPSIDQWSQELKFTTLSTGNDVVTIGIFGDMGVVNSQSMQLLSGEVAAGTINAVLHVGDYAYNMDEIEGLTGDIFLEELSNITSAVPYMGTPGNHEQAFNFSHFANRFSNFNFISDPAGKPDQNWWYSWDITSGGSNIHFISLDTELYYWAYASKAAQDHNLTDAQVRNFQQMIVEQYNWLVQDLTTSYDSGKYDWIFAYGHRPMYCSNIDDVPDCTDDAEVLRLGPKRDGNYGFETAFKLRPVDIYFSAHEHSYERTLPVKNGVIDYQKDPNMYIDPLYTTQIITGAGGCREFYDWYDNVFYGPWSILRSVSYGYGRLTIHNSTHLHWEQLLDEGRAGTDPLWIIKQAQRKVFTNETEVTGLFPSDESHATIESTSVDQEIVPTKPIEVAIEVPVAVPAAPVLIPTHQPQQIATE